MASLADNALTTYQTLVEELGIDTGCDENLLIRYINSASDAMQGYMGRQLGRATVTDEKQSGHGGKIMLLDRWPLISITEVKYDSSALATDEYEIYDANVGSLYHRTGVWVWTAQVVNDIEQTPYPGNEEKLYEVTYVAGYILPKDTGRTLPYDIEDAVIQMVTTRYRSQGRDGSVKSEKLSKYSVTYGGWSFSPTVVEVMNRYKRFV